MEFAMDMLAYCGLYCDHCSCRVAVAERDLRHLDSLPVKSRAARPDLADNDCEGCKGRNLCGPCALKDCAAPRRIDHCGECADFPCEKLEAFGNDRWPHHHQALRNLRAIRERGVEAWFAEYRSRLRCSCGARKSWYCGCADHPDAPEDAGGFFTA